MSLHASDTGGWSASAVMCAGADEVLAALTDPDLIASWSPVGFDVDGLAVSRLRAGVRVRVRGAVAGVSTAFDVEVLRADASGLELVATGPVDLDVTYSLVPDDDGVLVAAHVAVAGRPGVAARMLHAAVAGMLRGGALRGALERLARAVDGERRLVAA